MNDTEKVYSVFETGVVKERLYVLVKQLHHNKVFNWAEPVRRVLETVEANLLLKRHPFYKCQPRYNITEFSDEDDLGVVETQYRVTVQTCEGVMVFTYIRCEAIAEVKFTFDGITIHL